jgi:predicted DNA-binding protein with PD1-like motif
MHSRELTTGRTFGVRFDAGESFFPALEELCRSNGIRCGYIPMFLAAFAEADIVGTCDRLDDPAAPVWSKVHLANAEALGCGTIAYDEREGRIVPHVHTTLGLKEHSATVHQPPACGPRPVPGGDDHGRGDLACHDPASEPRLVRRPAAHLRGPRLTALRPIRAVGGAGPLARQVSGKA